MKRELGKVVNMQYRVFFEICGKKIQVVIEAESAKDAKAKIRDKIIFHKIARVEEEPDIMDFLKNTFGMT